MLDPYTQKPSEYLFTARDNRGLPGEFRYFRSADGYVFIGDVPENLSEYYSGGYQRIPSTEAELSEMAKTDAYRLDEIKKIVSQGTFLEIGSWIGLVAYSAKKAGFQVSVLEMNDRCVSLMKDVGIAAVKTDDPATTLRNSKKSYDVIGLWHSIEHMVEPWKVVEAAAQALNPGGVLVIAAPNPNSAQFKILGKRWVHLDAPRHLHFMTVEQFENIGREAGLLTVNKTSADKLAKDLDQHGWTFELQRYIRDTPLLRGIFRLRPDLLLARIIQRRDDFDGSSFTLMMRRPA